MLLILAIAAGAVWYAISTRQNQTTEFLVLSLIQQMRELQQDLDYTCEHLSKDLGAIMEDSSQKDFHSSGSLNSLQLDTRISTSSPRTELKNHGLQDHGTKLSHQEMVDTIEQELRLTGSDIEVQQHLMQQNMQQNPSKKPCRICLRLKTLIMEK